MNATMGWNKKAARWFKKHEGKVIALGKRTLCDAFPELRRVPWNKENSTRAANEWWRNFETGQGKGLQAELGEQRATLQAQAEAKRGQARQSQEEAERLESEAGGTLLDMARLEARKISGKAGIFPEAPLPKVNLQRVKASPSSLSSVATQFLRHKTSSKSKKSRGCSAGRVACLKSYLDDSIRVLGDVEISALDETALRTYWNFLDTSSLASDTCCARMQALKGLVGWSYEEGLLDRLPRNMSRLHFTSELKTVSPASSEEIQTVLTALRGSLLTVRRECDRFCLRLMIASILLRINVGACTLDIAAMKWSQIDFAAGTLSYKRNKLQRFDKKEPVIYPLWTETVEALKALPQSSELVFVNTMGESIFKCELSETHTLLRTDNLASNWQRYSERLFPTLKKPLKAFRKSGAELMSHCGYRQHCDLFLQHSNGITDRNYLTGNHPEFATAVIAVGVKLGLHVA